MNFRGIKMNVYQKIPVGIRNFIKLYLYRAYGNLNYLRFLNLREPHHGWPALLGISIPKSGTNLLMQILEGFSHVAPFTPFSPYFIRRWDKVAGRYIDEATTLERLSKVKPRDVVSGHLSSHSHIVQRVTTPNFQSYFIYRDPRDIAVSHTFWATANIGRWKRPYYLHLSLDERIRQEIVGFKSDKVDYPNIRTRFNSFEGWFGQPGVLNIRFEDLIHQRHQTLKKIACYFLDRVDTLTTSSDSIVEILEKIINPHRSPTFRSGKTGEWRQHFTEEHKKLFKDVAGDLLVQLGYEKNNDW